MERVKNMAPEYAGEDVAGTKFYTCRKCWALFITSYCPYCMLDRSIKQALIYARLEPGGA